MASRDWPNLAQHAKGRREELGLTQEAVAASGGPSTATLRLIENTGAKSYRAKSLSQLETALRWRPGSVRRVLAGGEPIPLDDDGMPPQRLTAIGEHLAQRRRALDERWRDPNTFATETRTDLLLIEAVETRADPQLSDGHVHQLARAYRLAPDALRAALNGGSLDFPDPVISDDEAYVRSMESRFEPHHWAALAAVVRAMFEPTAPAAEQEHRRTA